jgi:hypothetical protein
MRGSAVVLFVWALGCGVAATPRTRVVLDERPSTEIGGVAVTAVNGTGRELPMPQPGIVERAVIAATGAPPARATVADAFAEAAATRLSSAAAADGRRLRITLLAWDVRNDGAAGAVVFVSAKYDLFEADGRLVWQALQERLPVRSSGPNVDRHEVSLIAERSVADALALLGAGDR